MTIRKLLFMSALSLAACGDDGGNGPGPGEEEGPVYVMMTQVYTTDDRIIYFNTMDSLDVTSVSFADATEAPGVANFTTLAGKLYISSGEQPKITQYNVAADHSLEATGEISFGAYPLGDNANLYYHLIVDENLVFLPYEVNKRIAWNPSEMTILADKPTSGIATTSAGLMLNSGGNRTALKYPTGPVAAPFFYTNETWESFAPTSPVAIYDKTSFDEQRVENVACPGLTLTTRDEDGNTYFSTNVFSPVKALFGEGTGPCVAVMSPSGTFTTTDLRDMTGGRYVHNFRYLRDGLAFGHVLNHQASGIDFTQPYTAEAEETLYGFYELWLFDLTNNTAKKVEGHDLDEPPSQHAVIDGRMFLFNVFAEYGMTRVYELSEQGVLTKKFDVPGDVFKWERLR